jgi:hypothetical protein
MDVSLRLILAVSIENADPGNLPICEEISGGIA